MLQAPKQEEMNKNRRICTTCHTHLVPLLSTLDHFLSSLTFLLSTTRILFSTSLKGEFSSSTLFFFHQLPHFTFNFPAVSPTSLNKTAKSTRHIYMAGAPSTSTTYSFPFCKITISFTTICLYKDDLVVSSLF